MGFFVDFHLEKELLVTAWVANIKMNDVQPEVPTLTFQGEERARGVREGSGKKVVWGMGRGRDKEEKAQRIIDVTEIKF